jgi:hypothetical protein
MQHDGITKHVQKHAKLVVALQINWTKVEGAF